MLQLLFSFQKYPQTLPVVGLLSSSLLPAPPLHPARLYAGLLLDQNTLGFQPNLSIAFNSPA
jgi:hypothetical protein